MNVKQRLRQYLNSINESQSEMARKTGFSHTILVKGENLGSDKLKRFSEVYGLSIYWMIYGRENEDKVKSELNHFSTDEILGYMNENKSLFKDKLEGLVLKSSFEFERVGFVFRRLEELEKRVKVLEDKLR